MDSLCRALVLVLVFVLVFALSGEGLVIPLAAQSQAAPSGIPVNPVQAIALDSLSLQNLLGQRLDPPPPCDSLEEPSLKTKARSWFERISAIDQDPSLHSIQRDNQPYRLNYRIQYQWRDEICFPDRRTHCLATEYDPSEIRFGRELVTGAKTEHPGPRPQGQSKFCQSYDEGRFLICQEWDTYIGNSCWGTETTEGYERVQSGLTPLRRR